MCVCVSMQKASWLFVRQQDLTVQCYLPSCPISNPILAERLTICCMLATSSSTKILFLNYVLVKICADVKKPIN